MYGAAFIFKWSSIVQALLPALSGVVKTYFSSSEIKKKFIFL